MVVRSSGRASDTATILLHGAAGSWTTWTPLLRAAAVSGEPLSDVVAVDLPGWGESRHAATAPTVAILSRAVCEVAAALGYERWIVVGHSLGGFLALDIAAHTGARTAGVLAVSASGPAIVDAVRHPLRGLRTVPWFVGLLLTMRVLAGLGSLGVRVVRLLHRLGALRALTAPLFAAPAHVHHSVIDAFAHELRPRAFVEAARAAAAYDLSLWRAISCPVRTIRGERDVFVHASDEDRLAALASDVVQTTLPGAGHFAAVERPQVVAEALGELLAAVGSSPASCR